MSEEESYIEFRRLFSRLIEFKLPDGIGRNSEGLKTVVQLMSKEVPPDKYRLCAKLISTLLKNFIALSVKNGYHYAIANNNDQLAQICFKTIVNFSITDISSGTCDLILEPHLNVSKNTSENEKRLNSVCGSSNNNILCSIPERVCDEIPVVVRNNDVSAIQTLSTTATIETADPRNRKRCSPKLKYISSRHPRSLSVSSTDSEAKVLSKKCKDNKRPRTGKLYASNKQRELKVNSNVRHYKLDADDSDELFQVADNYKSSRKRNDYSTSENKKKSKGRGRSRKRSLDSIAERYHSESAKPLDKAVKDKINKRSKRSISVSENEMRRKYVDLKSRSDKYYRRRVRDESFDSDNDDSGIHYESNGKGRGRRYKSKGKGGIRRIIKKYKRQHSSCSESESQSGSEVDRRYKPQNKDNRRYNSNTSQSDDSPPKRRRVTSDRKLQKRREYILPALKTVSPSPNVYYKRDKSNVVKRNERRNESPSSSPSLSESNKTYESRSNLRRSLSESEASGRNKYISSRSKSRKVETDSEDETSPKSKAKNCSDAKKVSVTRIMCKSTAADRNKKESNSLKNKSDPLDWSKSGSQNTSLFMARLKQLDAEVLKHTPDPLEIGKNKNHNSKARNKKSPAATKAKNTKNKNVSSDNKKSPCETFSKNKGKSNKKSPAASPQSRATTKKSPATSTQRKAANKNLPTANVQSKAVNEKSSVASAESKSRNKKLPAGRAQRKAVDKKSPAANAQRKEINKKSPAAGSSQKKTATSNKLPADSSQKESVNKKGVTSSQKKTAVKGKSPAASKSNTNKPSSKSVSKPSNKKLPAKKTQTSKSVTEKVGAKKAKVNSGKAGTKNKQTTKPKKMGEEKNINVTDEDKVNCDNKNKPSTSKLNEIESKDANKTDRDHVENTVNKNGDSFSSDEDLNFGSEPELGTLSACLNSIRKKLPRQVGSATPPMNLFLSPHSDTLSFSSMSSSYSDVPMKIDDKNVVKRMAKANKPKELKIPETTLQKLKATPEALRKIMKIKKATESNDDSDIECSSFSE